ncbi:MAG TPA: hypothetical protein ENK66_00750, partial [Arcobacter sp.]|nr:hypothetical protein [Arcobacter sp.]
MIKVTKDLNDIPETLVKGSTLSKRNGVISSKKFPSSNSSSSEKEKKKVKDYESRYKQSDIKKSLKLIYNGKCAFCEQKIIECKDNNLEECSSTVEHYRPKSKYYWLAYSWDNLLWCCYRCNQNKDNNFETVNSPVEYEKSFKDKIHVSTKSYQGVEEPKMIHPELESVIKKLSFNNGVISSNDPRIEYTIETCRLDRGDLNEKRQTLIDDFIAN